MTANDAEALALRAVAYLAADQKRLSRLMALAGLAPPDLYERLESRIFLTGILDFVLGDEAMVLDFASEAGLPPDSVGRARARLSDTQLDSDSI